MFYFNIMINPFGDGKYKLASPRHIVSGINHFGNACNPWLRTGARLMRTAVHSFLLARSRDPSAFALCRPVVRSRVASKMTINSLAKGGWNREQMTCFRKVRAKKRVLSHFK